MNELKILLKVLGIWIILFLFIQPLFAQGYGGPLTFQGVDHDVLHSVAGRAMGGIGIGVQNDIGLMFQNPATLYSIKGIQISFAGLTTSTDLNQEQDYAPVRYYSNLSLLLEGLTYRIPNPDTSLIGFTAQDTVQRPFDDIGPNWSRSSNQNIPLQALIAVPVNLGKARIIAGFGAVKYADLTHYYQNNNVLSPSILSQRPLPTLRPADDNPINVDWFQSVRSRKGSIQGYGFSLVGSLEKHHLSVGFSGMILRGSSDDYELMVGRGNLAFFSNAFRLDSVYSRITSTGTSDFKGQEFTLSSILTGRYVSIGFSLTPPSTITRSYSMEVATDTTGTPAFSTNQGEDKLKLPWRGAISLSLNPRENLTLGLEYEFRPYESVRYIDANGVETSPWLSSSLYHVGVQYLIAPWFALRGGMRGQSEVFEPEGSKITGEPVTYTVYSAGIGGIFSGVHLDITYEYALIKYADTWSSAISKNSQKQHTIAAQLSYDIPWTP
jgi:hypothetical protein